MVEWLNVQVHTIVFRTGKRLGVGTVGFSLMDIAAAGLLVQTRAHQEATNDNSRDFFNRSVFKYRLAPSEQ